MEEYVEGKKMRGKARESRNKQDARVEGRSNEGYKFTKRR
jgi:hypothetical protein